MATIKRLYVWFYPEKWVNWAFAQRLGVFVGMLLIWAGAGTFEFFFWLGKVAFMIYAGWFLAKTLSDGTA